MDVRVPPLHVGQPLCCSPWSALDHQVGQTERGAPGHGHESPDSGSGGGGAQTSRESLRCESLWWPSSLSSLSSMCLRPQGSGGREPWAVEPLASVGTGVWWGEEWVMQTHADVSAGGGLDKEWPPSCTAAGITNARGLSSQHLPHGCMLLAFLTSGFGPWCWTWIPLHVWWIPTQHPLLGGAVVSS